MVRIKGPITLGKDKGIPQKLIDAIGNTKLPFTANNFTYSNKALNGKQFTMADGCKCECRNGKFEKI